MNCEEMPLVACTMARGCIIVLVAVAIGRCYFLFKMYWSRRKLSLNITIIISSDTNRFIYILWQHRKKGCVQKIIYNNVSCKLAVVYICVGQFTFWCYL